MLRTTTPVSARSAGVSAVAALAIVLAPTAAMTASAEIAPNPVEVTAAGAAFSLDPVGSYDTGVFDESAAEIVEYFAAAERLFVVNASAGLVEVLSIADPAAPEKLFDLETAGVVASDGVAIPAGATVNSVDVRPDGLGVIAVEAPLKTDPGWVVFFDAAADGEALGAVGVGSLPDMVTFTPDGTRIVVANEGEPADDYSVDPEGSVSVITAPATVESATDTDVATAGFAAFEEGGALTLPAGIRIFGGREDAGTGTPEFPVSENLEPEYAAISPDSSTAWVSLQEANGIAVVDLASATVTSILDLGTVDRMDIPFDPSDRDGVDGEGAIAIANWPVLGYYMPDTIVSYEAAGSTYIVTANEGDSRDWSGYSEVARVKDLGSDGLAPVCADAFDDVLGANGLPADIDGFLADDALGRLNITTANGLDPDAECYSDLYTYGARSFSIRDTSGALVWDSADAFEQLVAEASPLFFNSNHSESNLDGRSDDKGPEPEAVAVGEIDGRSYAFVGFERVGGIAAFDITVPTDARFVTYLNNRDFSVSAEDDGLAGAGDLGTEGIRFITDDESSTGEPMLAVANEVSGSTTMYALELAADVPAPGDGTDDGTDDGSGDGVGSGGDSAADPTDDASAPTLANTGSDASRAAITAATLLTLLGGALVLGRAALARRRTPSAS
ncbi:choice-of-anchor I family protein [Marisediminicola sp. LYQ134]|uniref:choice-of-anchor I family protein n=1 Tax=Marisediminicola sp. LYQ134 TaxID=3391061 RepID=UPI003983D87C